MERYIEKLRKEIEETDESITAVDTNDNAVHYFTGYSRGLERALLLLRDYFEIIIQEYDEGKT